MDIAIIGSGISGLSAAWALRDDHKVRIFERDQHPGGHVKTVTVPTAEGPVNVDTGFIVYNEPTYPYLTALFEELGIETQPTEMSLGHACVACGIEFGSRKPVSMFAQPASIARPSHWLMINDIRRFYRAARERLDNDVWTRDTLADFFEQGGYGNAFRNHFLVPVVSAVWSTSAAEIMDFPVDYLLRFLDNHGLIGFGQGKPWRTVVGGSMTYVDRIIERLPDDALVAGDPVVDVHRDEDGVSVSTLSGRTERFDAVVMATHADVSLRLLNDADAAERKALGLFEYTTNDVVLHTDTSVLPRRRRAWGAWNSTIPRADDGEVRVTYDMNILQSLSGPTTFCVTLNATEDINPNSILFQTTYRHPQYSLAGFRAQARHEEISGRNRTHYCGAYWGYGFHEDGVRSGVKVAEAVGVDF